MSSPAFLSSTMLEVDAATTSGNGNIAIDGTYSGTIDGQALANNKIYYLQYQTDVTQRAAYSTGTDHTQPWTKVAYTQVSLAAGAPMIYVKTGSTLGAAAYVINNPATGVMTALGSGGGGYAPPTIFGTVANGGYQDSVRGIFKYIDSAALTIPTGSSLSVPLTFATGGATVPFTSTSGMRIESVVATDTASTGSDYLVVTGVTISAVTGVTVIVQNPGISTTTAKVRVNVSQLS